MFQTKNALDFHEIINTLRRKFKGIVSRQDSVQVIKEYKINFFPESIFEKGMIEVKYQKKLSEF